MKLKKYYSFSSNKQLWRLLINDKDDLMIESRDNDTKEVSYFFINIPSKNVIRNKINLPDNVWIAVESYFGNMVYFHKFVKPDLPIHSGIIAYDLTKDAIIWENPNYRFFIVDEDYLIAQKQGFEETQLVKLDLQNGEFLENISLPLEEIEIMHNNFVDKFNYDFYDYPDNFNLTDNDLLSKTLDKYTKKFPLKFTPQVMFYENFIFCNFHLLTNKGIDNYFIALDTDKEKITEEIILNKNVKGFVPESFFTYKNYLFLLKDKTELIIYKLE